MNDSICMSEKRRRTIEGITQNIYMRLRFSTAKDTVDQTQIFTKFSFRHLKRDFVTTRCTSPLQSRW